MSLPLVLPLSRQGEAQFKAIIAGKAKPPGSLGRLEDLALQLALIAGDPAPAVERALLLVFAGDHGLTQSGVSAYPASVTKAMVQTLLAGKASANALARAVGAKVRVVDAGVAAELDPHPKLIAAKVAMGTGDAAKGPAMTSTEAEAALGLGAQIAAEALAEGFDVLALGEMGIGNSASAALLMHRLAPAPLADCIGLGAGHDAEGLARKSRAIQAAAARSDVTEPLEVLGQFGGLEIAMMAGAVIGAAHLRRPVVVDGFIGTAAALVAIRLQAAARDYCLFAHASAERGHRLMLDALQARPLLDLDLRLGEGTGALLALPLLRAASRMMSEVASLEDVLEGRV